MAWSSRPAALGRGCAAGRPGWALNGQARTLEEVPKTPPPDCRPRQRGRRGALAARHRALPPRRQPPHDANAPARRRRRRRRFSPGGPQTPLESDAPVPSAAAAAIPGAAGVTGAARPPGTTPMPRPAGDAVTPRFSPGGPLRVRRACTDGRAMTRHGVGARPGQGRILVAQVGVRKLSGTAAAARLGRDLNRVAGPPASAWIVAAITAQARRGHRLRCRLQPRVAAREDRRSRSLTLLGWASRSDGK